MTRKEGNRLKSNRISLSKLFLIVNALLIVMIFGCKQLPGVQPFRDGGTVDTDIDSDADTDETGHMNIGFSAGGGSVETSNYKLRLTVGTAPMAQRKSTNYRASIGVGSLATK